VGSPAELDEVESGRRVVGRVVGDELDAVVGRVDPQLLYRGARRQRGHGTAVAGGHSEFDVDPVGHT
jgi:hypothetical protein